MDKVGRYQVRELLGEGAMARVYRAYDPDIDRELAIKFMKSQLHGDGEYVARFLREAKGAGVLSHPNIVTVFDVGDDDGHPYIAMELIEGGDLGDLLDPKKLLPVTTVVDVGIQLVKALDYAHKKGIVHRDVKPGNIMVIRGTTTIKVADFGICRIDNSEATQATQAGDVIGTPNYMSPEQVLGEKIDSRSDLFSAGVVLYQLLTGRLPFEGDSLVAVAFKIVKEEPPSLDKLRPDLPLSLRRVVERALKKQPEKRFQTGDEFAQALIGVAREIKEEEERKGRGRRIPLGVRWAVMMAALVATTMIITATFLYRQQYAAMMAQVEGYGGSLAKFMATQTAVPLLSEDWAAIDVFIQETISRQDFNYIVVQDHQGVVRGANDPARISQTFALPDARSLPSHDESVTVQSFRLPDGRAVLDFTAPIVFQNKTLGLVHLGIYEAPLQKVANLMLWLLGILTLVTTAAGAVGSFLLARRLQAPIRVLRNSFDELAKGRYDYRIAEDRKDEFGELYTAFDRTAATLEQRHEPAPPSKPVAAP